jgi:hypothetical protein
MVIPPEHAQDVGGLEADVDVGRGAVGIRAGAELRRQSLLGDELVVLALALERVRHDALAVAELLRVTVDDVLDVEHDLDRARLRVDEIGPRARCTQDVIPDQRLLRSELRRQTLDRDVELDAGGMVGGRRARALRERESGQADCEHGRHEVVAT